jgi:hypothetical protein
LIINIRKSQFIAFGRARNLVSSIRIAGELVQKSEHVNLLGLRIDSNLQWTFHVNYVCSRIRQFRMLFSRLPVLYDSSIRVHLTKTFVLPVINLYNFIYGVAPARTLHTLNTAYNDLMRCITHCTRSQRVKIMDLYDKTSLLPLHVYRHQSLSNFIHRVINGSTHSEIRATLTKPNHNYVTRSHNQYVIPVSNTRIGQLRVSVRGLAIVNSAINTT